MKKLISDTRLVLDQIIGTIGNRLRLNQCKMIRILMIDRKFKKIHYKTLLVSIHAFLPQTHTIFLEKHFNVSAAQAKKFMNQIKNQLHVNPPGEVTFSTFLTTFSYLFSERRYKLEIRAAWRVDSFCRKRLDFPFSRLQIESK